jgi:hypothetical protein
MKPQPTFCVSVKLWLHSDVCIWTPSLLDPQDLNSISLGAIWNLAKQQGSHKLIWGTKGQSIKAQVHRDRNVSNSNVNKTTDHQSPHHQPGCCFSKSCLGTLFLNQVLQLWLQSQSSHTCLICFSGLSLYFIWSHFVTSHGTQSNCLHVSPGFCFAFNLTT